MLHFIGEVKPDLVGLSLSVYFDMPALISTIEAVKSNFTTLTLMVNRRLGSEIKTLSGLLPIWTHCKKMRDDKGYWNQIKAYIQDRSQAEFSHSICRECAEKYYPDSDLGADWLKAATVRSSHG
ncbi:MAG: hypothetical protein V1793_06015 [Pseudomonadota bacterium]